MNGKLGLLILGGGLVVGAWAFWSSSNDQTSAERAYEAAEVSLSPEAERGRLHFNQNCAECHGRDARGGPGGPSLITRIYEPSHHADGAFYLAVQRGVPQHHANFGDMPPMSDRVTQDQVAEIIAFVRETQRANGIF